MSPARPAAGDLGQRLDGLLRTLRRRLRRHRRLAVAAAVALAVAAGLRALAPPAPKTDPVVVATRDVPAGARLGDGDVRVVAWPRGLVPGGALAGTPAAVGRTTTSPLRAGEAVTGTRLVGASLLAGAGPPDGPALVATAVRLADPAVPSLLSVGVVVDVLAAVDPTLDPSGTAPRQASLVAPAARVLAVPEPARGTGAGDGGLVVLAVPERTAAELAQASVTARLSVVLRP